MDRQNLLNFTTFLCILVIFFPNLSADSHFEACTPRNCGNGPKISYPFWIPEEQEYFCGYPNFEITCKEENPVLTISEGSFIIKDIFYDNNSLLVDAVVYEDDCPTPRQNVSLDRTPFDLSLDNVNFSFLYDCEERPEYHTYPVSCANNASLHSFAVFHKEFIKTNYSLESCRSFVDAPVYIKDDVNFVSLLEMKYTQVLRMGFVLNWTTHSCSNCKRSGGRCGFDNRNEFVCFCSDGSHPKTCNDGRNHPDWKVKLVIGLGSAGSSLLMITCIIILCFRRMSLHLKAMGFRWKFRNNDQDIEAFIRNNGNLAPKRYSYSDARRMTNWFKEQLGKGGYGSVYKGKLLDGRLVAVKLLNASKGNGQEFINEVASISRTSHVNVVTLLGFCLEGQKRALIYEFMPNGSLERFIYRENTKDLKDCRQQLKPAELYRIAIGIARGLEYLHRGCNTRILHFDIKPHNILLDENFCPKISDFGLAKLCTLKESFVSMLEARGTIGYIAPEVFCRSVGAVSHKSDVYSYGMMILEMVGGRRNIDVGVSQSSEIYFPHWIYRHLEQGNMEPKSLGLMTKEETEIARKMMIVGLWCIQTNSAGRPSITKVIEMLEGSIEALQIPPRPYLSSSPPTSPIPDSTSISLS